MDIRNQRGITLVMLVITIIVMLIIVTVLINFSIGDNSLMESAQKTKIKEEIRTIQSKVESEIKSKQAVKGTTEGVTLTVNEQKEILGEYFSEEKLVVDKNGRLCRHFGGNWKDMNDFLDSIRYISNR